MSVSSSEGSPAPTDLVGKYQKLASEYAKVRSQISVLKQAIRDEQIRNASLKEEMKLKDQEIRKNGQEIDSLTFRNQQLTKRVAILQEEFDNVQINAKKVRSQPVNNHVEEESQLFQEELRKRITENATLLSQVEEQKLLLDQERNQSKDTIESLQKSLQEVKQAQFECQCRYVREENGCQAKSEQSFVTSQAVWTTLKTLPVADVIINCKSVIDIFSDIDSSAMLRLVDVFNSSSQEAAELKLKKLLSLLNSLAVDLKLRHPFSGNILSNLGTLVTELLRYSRSENFLISRVDGLPFEEATQNLTSTIRNELSSSTTQHSDAAKLALLRLVDSCNVLRLEFEKCSLTLFQNSFHDSQASCVQCSVLHEAFEKKICALEKYIHELAKNSNGFFYASPTKAVTENESIESETSKRTITERYNRMLEDLQLAESKLTRVLTERGSLQCNLEEAMENLREKNQRLSRLEEEMSVTTRNYEDQLGSLSEHMANMNDKLAAQETMIEELTCALKNKDKKGRMK